MKETIKELITKHPILQDIINMDPVVWFNPDLKFKSDLPAFSLNFEDCLKAEVLWKRFAPFFKIAFPETTSTNGFIESPLLPISQFQEHLNRSSFPTYGKMFLKCDHTLPIAGSIKARGGFYEVLEYAEKLALKHNLLRNKGVPYSIFSSDSFKAFFNQHTLGVASTGNLGLSIGILGTQLGFKVKVYVSRDAKQWKKDLLREKGAEVIEFKGDFSVAIQAGRNATLNIPNAYFIDDEDSKALFLGYTVGAIRIAKQLKLKNIIVDEAHPLFVYLPCGVGGSPGGITFGLKQIFGDHVHCFFVEPTHSPSVLIGLITSKMSNISVQEIGLDNNTEADGLAVGRASKFATEISKHLISGIYTIKDNDLFKYLSILQDTEQIFLEPSATAGLLGPQKIFKTSYLSNHTLHKDNSTHIVWATGGDLVPEKQREEFYKKGKRLK